MITATCTGTATAANTTCDLDGSTDGTADCPGGCSMSAAVVGVRTEPCDTGGWATADVGWAHVACDRAGGRVVLVSLGSPRRAGGLGGDIASLTPLAHLRSLSLSANNGVHGDLTFLRENMPELVSIHAMQSLPSRLSLISRHTSDADTLLVIELTAVPRPRRDVCSWRYHAASCSNDTPGRELDTARPWWQNSTERRPAIEASACAGAGRGGKFARKPLAATT